VVCLPLSHHVFYLRFLQLCLGGMLRKPRYLPSTSFANTNMCLRSSAFLPPRGLTFNFELFSDSQTFMSHLKKKNKECGYAGYMKKHVKYPPGGLLPLPGKNTTADPGCDLWSEIFGAALLVNPAFNIYRIFDVVSMLLSLAVPRK